MGCAQGGKHALDYITTYNRSVLNANPCSPNVTCTSPQTTFPIPADPAVTGAGVTPIAGVFTMWGGTISNASGYSVSGGDNSTQITLTFTAAPPQVVLSWGGHIATRLDWGAQNSAVSISGSPYHTRLIAVDGSGGNQDRSLSADAVIFPGSIKIVKDAVPDDPQVFSFTASPLPLTGFTLTDDG